MHDSALDFLVFILVLGLVVALGFNFTIPVVKQAKEMSYVETYDKTADNLKGLNITNDYDGCLSSDEIVLMAMSQTYFMPKPGFMEINGQAIKVSDSMAFSPNSLSIGSQVDTEIKNWFNRYKSSSTINKLDNPPKQLKNARFKITYSMNDPDDIEDDSYSLFILLTRNDEGARAELFKCEKDGKLRDKDGDLL